MARWRSLKEVLVLAVNNRRLWLLQFFSNAAIFLAFVWWLRISEAHWWNLLFSFLLIAAMVAAALLLHGGTLAYFQSAHEDRAARLQPAFRTALRHLAAIFVWALIFFLLRDWIGRLDRYDIIFPGYLRSEFPAWLRRMISEPRLDSIYSGFVSILRWVILPGLLLPFALFSADKGFRGLIAASDWRRTLRSVSYWLTLVVAAIVGVWWVEAIMGWKLDPKIATLQAEKSSLAVRLLFAYLLGLFSWLLVCSVLGRRVTRSVRQSGTQPQ
jgi:predicted ribosomally synthesized peptide with SipW-like signal peptide